MLKSLSWDCFIFNLKQDFKVFIFTWLYLNMLRAVSIAAMRQYAGDIGFSDAAAALFYGARMSLKTAGALMLFTFVFATLVNFVLNRRNDKMRLALASLFFFAAHILFIAKFFYYKEFHTSFNEMVFNAANDDVFALLQTFAAQYHLIDGVIGAAAFTALIIYLLRRFAAKNFTRRISFGSSLLSKTATIALLFLFALFVRFGASFSYADSIHWENCAKTKDSFLNEMILDDMQAVYRGYSIKKRIDNGIIYGVNQTRIKAYAEDMAKYSDSERLGKKDLSQIDANLYYEANGGAVGRKQRIFIIIGESFAQWPLWDEYAALHLGDNIKAIIQKPNSAYTERFMPNGAFTPMAVNAVISGLSDVNIYPNHQYESYKQVYAASLAPQLKKLGYKTEFWYSGFSGWERIKDFALAQGFDEFHCASDYNYPSGNVWGCDDAFLFEQLKKEAEQNDEPAAYVVLSVSNHAPYSVDLEKEGFPKEQTIKALPAEKQSDEELINRLGHYWYTDKVIGGFVNEIEEKYIGENLFIITGDHADRTNIEDQPSLSARYSVPFIVYGEGISKNSLPAGAAGGHINIGATLFELVAPKGFGYYSLGRSLTRGADVGFNDTVWITPSGIGKIDGTEPDAVKAALERFRTVSWQRTMRGNSLENQE